MSDTPLTDESISWHTAYAGYGSDRMEMKVEHVEVSDCRNIERELREQLATVTAERDAALKDAERDAARLLFAFVDCDGYGDICFYDRALVYASAFGRDKPNDNDKLAAIRDALDAAMKEKNDAR